MSLLHIALAYVLVAAAVSLFVWSLCVVASRSDDQAQEALRRERDEREARSELYGGTGGWRG